MKTKLLIALGFPIALLLGMALYNEYLSQTHTEYKFPIEAYDPRDYLAGNFLNFKIKYPIETKCDGEGYNYSEAHICLKPVTKFVIGKDIQDCEEWISGKCSYKNFVDDLNRFYVPQDKALRLEHAIREGQGEIILSVGKGNAVVKDLKINGKSWKDY